MECTELTPKHRPAEEYTWTEGNYHLPVAILLRWNQIICEEVYLYFLWILRQIVTIIMTALSKQINWV